MNTEPPLDTKYLFNPPLDVRPFPFGEEIDSFKAVLYDMYLDPKGVVRCSFRTEYQKAEDDDRPVVLCFKATTEHIKQMFPEDAQLGDVFRVSDVDLSVFIISPMGYLYITPGFGDEKIQPGNIKLVRMDKMELEKERQKLVQTSEITPRFNIKFDFDKLNPMQSNVWKSGIIQNFKKNLIVSSPTASGKTVLMQIAVARCLEDYRPAIIVVPFKALCEEHHVTMKETFPNENIAIVTGDYELSAKQKRELAEADIILMTNEMLVSRLTKYESEGNEFLKEVGVIIYDEFHLISSEGRGDRVEVSIMQLNDINNRVKFILLSATMGRLELIKNWFEQLTGKDTVIVESDYRPTKLNVHYHGYDDGGKPWDTYPKLEVTEEIIDEHKDDKFIIFCPSRAETVITAKKFKNMGFECEYHNASLDLEQRRKIENDFKTGDLQIICSTTTLSTGVNLPARRTIIQGCHRGLNMMDPADIRQCMGRAGRPRFDTEGDAHVILPDLTKNVIKGRLDNINIDSVLTDSHTLKFHINNQVFLGGIKTRREAEDWWDKTFADLIMTEAKGLSSHQTLTSVVDRLRSIGCIKEKNDRLHTQTLGKIAAWMQLNPEDVVWFYYKLKVLKKKNLWNDDVALACLMVSKTQVRDANYVATAELEEVQYFLESNRSILETFECNDDVNAKHVQIWHKLFTDDKYRDGIALMMKADVDRLVQTLLLIDSFQHMDCKDLIKPVGIMAKYSVPRECAEIVTIRDVGGARARKLMKEGLLTIEDVASNTDIVIELLGEKTGKTVVDNANRKLKGRFSFGSMKETVKKKGKGGWRSIGKKKVSWREL